MTTRIAQLPMTLARRPVQSQARPSITRMLARWAAAFAALRASHHRLGAFDLARSAVASALLREPRD